MNKGTEFLQELQEYEASEDFVAYAIVAGLSGWVPSKSPSALSMAEPAAAELSHAA